MAFLDELFATLWSDHAALTPQAARLHQLLRERGDAVRIDHVALLTFDLPGVEIEALDRAFVAHGYQAAQSYELPAAGLTAYHYEHADDARRPKLLLGAVLVDELSAPAREIVRGLVGRVEPGASAHPLFAASGRRWTLSSSDYRILSEENQHAAWVAAFGFRAHHVAVDVGELRTFEGLGELDRFLEQHGFRIDQAGGAIKGSPDELLEQSSTLPDEIDVELSDGALRIPSGCCVLARRYPGPDGTLYQGYAAEPAARLFPAAGLG